MIDFLKRSHELSEYHINNRRCLHQIPELGTDLQKTISYVKERLEELGCDYKEIPHAGIVCQLGTDTGNTILLRADMDALPIQEESGLAFASQSPGISHSCGHDLHTSFLLGAARLLKECEEELPGLVQLIFQSGEETLEGAKNMIDAHILHQPPVDKAIGIHVQPLLPIGCLNYKKGAFLSSTDAFEIQIQGKGCHGGQPHMGTDPINVAAHLILALQSFQVKEVPADATAVLNICEIKSGSASNVVPDTATLQGTIRTYDNTLRQKIKTRTAQIAAATAEIFGAAAETRFTCSCPCTVNDPDFTEQISGYVDRMQASFQTDPGYKMQVSDDFGFFSERLPSLMFIIGCSPEEGTVSHNHSSTVRYNEDVLPTGAALLAHCAYCWLKDSQSID